ncbi:hypothetical protein SteCoe_27369 [Stentor coeruleus]|uniref:Rhodanese domain-containing protein n=1 Tax=Stentor coeruleus TaxID=5963 RepID=A0A1R2BAM6_9CILI|nr:hypothetical protein SteCoe_27369 [Stentor coeruleus]
MSIISVKDLPNLKDKTLIYFASSIPFDVLPDTFVCIVNEDLSNFVFKLRKIDILYFPIICYDDGDMKFASQAFWIFKAMGYPVFVLYGGIKACEDEGLELMSNCAPPLLEKKDPQFIDFNKLPKLCPDAVTVKALPFLFYEVLGQDITEEKVKKVLEAHRIDYNYSNCTLKGKCAGVFSLFLLYLKFSDVKVFLGEWSEPVPFRSGNSLAPETFHTVAESVYYDAIEGQSLSTNKVIDEDPVPEKVTVEHYSLSNVQPRKSIHPYQIEASTTNCRSCLLL